MSSSLQMDALLTTDIQCFQSTGVFPFSGSDHHIISYYCARGIFGRNLIHMHFSCGDV